MTKNRIKLIKNLPSQFDFTSQNDVYHGTYHAKNTGHNYIVTWQSQNINGEVQNHQTTYGIPEFRRKIFHGEFIPILEVQN